MKEIKTAMVSLGLGHSIPHGFANGYVGVPPGHPWHGKHYDDINVNIHGGLTYGSRTLPGQEQPDADGYYWVGFDTAHLGDSLETWPKERVEAEVESLKQQAIEQGGDKYVWLEEVKKLAVDACNQTHSAESYEAFVDALQQLIDRSPEP